MIPVSKLTALRLKDAKAGDFFMPRNTGGERYLLGKLNDKYTVAVDVDDPKATFHDLEPLAGSRGFIASEFDVLVSPTSATPFRPQHDQHAPPGSIILSGNSVGLYAVSRNTNFHVVMISGDQIADEDQAAVAFGDWSLSMSTVGAERVELFRRSAGADPT